MSIMANETSERVTARVPSQVKAKLEQAAAILGTNLNQFMVQTSIRVAQEIIEKEQNFIEQEQSIRLTRKDVAQFFETWEHTPEPSEHLRRAAGAHSKLINRA